MEVLYCLYSLVGGGGGSDLFVFSGDERVDVGGFGVW